MRRRRVSTTFEIVVARCVEGVTATVDPRGRRAGDVAALRHHDGRESFRLALRTVTCRDELERRPWVERSAVTELLNPKSNSAEDGGTEAAPP